MERGHNGNPARLAEYEWCFTYEPEQKNKCKGASGRKLRQVCVWCPNYQSRKQGEKNEKGD